MNTRPAGIHSTIALLAGAVCLLTISATPALAQRARHTIAERRATEMNRQREQYERDHLNDPPEKKSATSADRKQVQATFAQVKQDFEHVQSLYNQIVRGVSPHKALDYKLIEEATAEINKRANRLKNNLALPPPDGDDKDRKKEDATHDAQLRASLFTLCKHITSFVMNPLFESSGALDIELSRKASRDLQMIIELSESIRGGAEKLSKPHEKSSVSGTP